MAASVLLPAAPVTPEAQADSPTAAAGQGDAIESARRKRRRGGVKGSRNSGYSARPSMRGGFGFFAPWPAGNTWVAGGKCGNFHNRGAHRDWGGQWRDDRFAVDFGVCGKADFGTPILAAHSGTVRIATRDSEYGGTVVLEETKGGLATRYSHLDTVTVKKGQRLTPGQKLGTLGHSGPGGGDRKNAHLHFAAYKSNRARAGINPSPMAGVVLGDGDDVTSLTERVKDALPPFRAQLDSAVPLDPATSKVEARAGETFPFRLAVKFEQPFDPFSFVLRPADDMADRFTAPGGTLIGTQGPDPRIGYFEGLVQVPPNAAPGKTYTLRWDVRNLATGQLGNLRATIVLVVKEPLAAPGADGPVAFGNPEFLSPVDTVEIASGTSRIVDVRVRNRSARTWTRGQDNLHFVDANGNDLAYPYCGDAPEWVNGHTVHMREESVAHGDIATFGVKVCGQSGYSGHATLRLRYVREGVKAYDPVYEMPLSFIAPLSTTQPCPVTANSALPAQSFSPTLSAAEDGAFPRSPDGKVHVGRGGTVPIGWNIRFNQAFNATNHVLRPNTTNAINHFTPSMGTPGNDWPGAVAPNDSSVGYYRSSITVPACTPPGEYFMQWRVINRANGEWGRLEPSFVLVVE